MEKRYRYDFIYDADDKKYAHERKMLVLNKSHDRKNTSTTIIPQTSQLSLLTERYVGRKQRGTEDRLNAANVAFLRSLGLVVKNESRYSKYRG